MRKRHGILIVAVAVLLLLIAFAGTVTAKPSKATKPLTKNVIIMIADGTGYNNFLIGDYYQYGAAGTQVYEDYPFHFGVSTYPDTGWYNPLAAWTDFKFLKLLNAPPTTESDMAATAMATGYRNLGGVGTDNQGAKVPNILEYAESVGKATGVISTVQFDHATPAGFAAHQPSRDPLTTIAAQMINQSALDVIMGAGHPEFSDNNQTRTADYGPKAAIAKAEYDALKAGTAGADADGDGINDAWSLVESKQAFQSLQSGDVPDRVFGLARVASTLQQKRGGDVKVPYSAPRNADVPDLATMARGAINVLDNDPDGFVIMIEGGATDGAAHSTQKQTGRLIEELDDFNAAVEAVNAWVTANSNWGETLLIVTADHDTGGLWGPGAGVEEPAFPGDPATWKPIVNNGAGVMPGWDWYAEIQTDPSKPRDYWHTDMLVPLWAKGDAGRLFRTYADETDIVRGPYVNNTEIFQVMYRALGSPGLAN